MKPKKSTCRPMSSLSSAASSATSRSLNWSGRPTRSGCRPQESLRVEARHVDLKNSRWVFPQSEPKGKKAPRIVYLSEASLEITKRRMKQFPTGQLFRNSREVAWTPASANCAFNGLRWRMGQAEMKRLGEVISDAAPSVPTYVRQLRCCFES